MRFRLKFFWIKAALALLVALAVFPAASRAGGGPDAYGYIWREGGSWDWIDTENATALTMGDDNWRNLALAFPFTFYGREYEELWLVSNGYVVFTGPQSTFNNDCPLPTPQEPNGAIYIYWDDLAPPSGGIISYQVVGAEPYRHFVITFDRVPLFGYNSKLTAQLILTETVGWIQINYLDTGRMGEGATLGVENADGTAGMTTVCNEAAIRDDSRVYYGWPPVENFRYEPAGTALRLLWDDPAGAESFIVEYRPLDEMLWTQIGLTTQTALLDPDATECSIRQYRITAQAGDYGVSGPTEAYTLVYKPIKPTGLTAVMVAGQYVELHWTDNSTCEDGYVIERRAGDGPFLVLEQIEPDSTQYIDASLSAGLDSTYRVKAKKELMSGDYSDEAPVSTGLFAVTDLEANSYSDAKIELHWTDTSIGEQGYAVERRATATGDPFALISYVGPDTQSFLDYGLDSLTEYAYRIYPYSLTVPGPVSNVAMAATLEPDSPPIDDDTLDDDNDDYYPPGLADEEDKSTPGTCSACGM